MSQKLSGETFLAVVAKSGLVPAPRLTQLVDSFVSKGGDRTDALQLAEALVDKQVLSSWQAEKLLQGKHKGYFLGKYRLQSLLGRGGMSSVYLAEHVLMRRRCAIKVLPAKRVGDTSYLARFHREAQAVAALDHPNIVRAYDVDHQTDRDSEIHFLVMEYVEGCSLQELVTKQGPIGFADAANYMRQAALGLVHAHHAGLVHRDIKPGNLLLDKQGTVKILDLGLARFFNGNGDEEALTIQHDEKVLGTADYLAPEQALDSHNVDARADIYSLGCTFYFLLTGQPPFTEGTLAQRLMAHQNKDPAAIEQKRPDVPASLVEILRKMMAKKPDDRFHNASDTANALLHWLDQNADPAWRQSHSGVFSSLADSGRRPTPVAARVVVPAKTVVPPTPVASPAAPASTPEVIPSAAPFGPVTAMNPVVPVSEAAPELSAFFSSLGNAPAAPVAESFSPAILTGLSSKTIKSKSSSKPKPGNVSPVSKASPPSGVTVTEPVIVDIAPPPTAPTVPASKQTASNGPVDSTPAAPAIVVTPVTKPPTPAANVAPAVPVGKATAAKTIAVPAATVVAAPPTGTPAIAKPVTATPVTAASSAPPATPAAPLVAQPVVSKTPSTPAIVPPVAHVVAPVAATPAAPVLPSGPANKPAPATSGPDFSFLSGSSGSSPPPEEPAPALEGFPPVVLFDEPPVDEPTIEEEPEDVEAVSEEAVVADEPAASHLVASAEDESVASEEPETIEEAPVAAPVPEILGEWTFQAPESPVTNFFGIQIDTSPADNSTAPVPEIPSPEEELTTSNEESTEEWEPESEVEEEPAATGDEEALVPEPRETEEFSEPVAEVAEEPLLFGSLPQETSAAAPFGGLETGLPAGGFAVESAASTPTRRATTATSSKPKPVPATKAAATNKKGFSLPTNPNLLIGGAAAAIVLLLGLGWSLLGSGDKPASTTTAGKSAKSSKKTTAKSNRSTTDQTPEPAVASTTTNSAKSTMPPPSEAWANKRQATVGAGQEFPTLSAALVQVQKNFRPNSRGERFILKVSAGSYADRIVMDGKTWLDPDLTNVTIQGEGEVILNPNGADPVIRLQNTVGVQLTNLKVQGQGQAVAVELAEGLDRCALSKLQVSGFTQTGLLLSGALASSFTADRLSITQVTFQGTAQAMGIRGMKGKLPDSVDCQNIVIQKCRFLGPLAAGISVAGPDVRGWEVRECIFSQAESGVEFQAGAGWYDFQFLNNTFYQCPVAVRALRQPAPTSKGLTFRRNLFVGATGGEFVIKEGFDEKPLFQQQMMVTPEGNWSDQPAPASPMAGHVSLAAGGSQGQQGIEFVSTDPAAEKFLAPTPAAPQRAVAGQRAGEPAWVGAVGP